MRIENKPSYMSFGSLFFLNIDINYLIYSLLIEGLWFDVPFHISSKACVKFPIHTRISGKIPTRPILREGSRWCVPMGHTNKDSR